MPQPLQALGLRFGDFRGYTRALMVVAFWACHGLWYGIVIIRWGDRHYLHGEHELEDYELVGSTPNLVNLESEKSPPETEGSSRLNPGPSIIYTTEHLRVQGSR